MTKYRIGDDWWTTPTESEKGNRIIVTGRRGVDAAIFSGKFNDRVEITWEYQPDSDGMPDFKTSVMMEKVTEALSLAFGKDQAAVMTGIYTGDGERNWIFYSRNLQKFQLLLNQALMDFEVLPLRIYVEKDPDWNEYNEMKSLTELIEE